MSRENVELVRKMYTEKPAEERAGVSMTNRWGQVVTVRDALVTHRVVDRAPEEASKS